MLPGQQPGRVRTVLASDDYVNVHLSASTNVPRRDIQDRLLHLPGSWVNAVPLGDMLLC